MTYDPPWLPKRGPEVAIVQLLDSNWNSDNISGNFDKSRWLHTGSYDDSNPNPQVSVTPGNEPQVSETGYTGIDPSGGGPTAWKQGTVDVGVWVPHDEDPYPTTGTNPKKLAWELRREVERIVSEAEGTRYDGETEFQSLGVGTISTPPEPPDSPVEHRYDIPVMYTYYKGRVSE